MDGLDSKGTELISVVGGLGRHVGDPHGRTRGFAPHSSTFIVNTGAGEHGTVARGQNLVASLCLSSHHPL